MKQLNFLNREEPKLEITLQDAEGKEVTVTLKRKKILVKDAASHQEYLQELDKKRVEGELTDIDYTFSVIDALVDGFDKALFENIELYYLREIADAVAALGAETPKEKKSE